VYRRTRNAVGMSAIRGFTLLEALIALCIIGVLAAIAVPRYQDYVYRAQVAQAVTDITALSVKIKHYELDQRTLPDSLADIRANGMRDPWGYPYRYLNLVAAGNLGHARKDKNLNPLNSDFDLYSVGRDGRTSSPLTARASQDDVVRANDGKFVGLGADF